MRVLHLIERYLPPSQVWLYLLLKQTQQEVRHHIGTREVIDDQFLSANFRVREAKRGPYRLALKRISGRPWQRYGKRLKWELEYLLQPSEAREWSAYVQANKIDLIHVHFGPHACEHLAWLRTSAVPFVVSFYGYDYEKAPFQKPRLRAAYRELFLQAQAVICEGKHGQKILVEQYGCPQEKLHLVPLGIDLPDWPAPELKPKKTGQLRLLQVADFTPKKGQLATIEAAIGAKQQVPNLSLTLVGRPRDTQYWQACQDMIRQSDAQDWISVREFVPLTALRKLMLEHDAFIHPSRYAADRDCEGGAPTILFYAQCLGLPVISTLHCDIPGIVKAGTSGQLFAEGDVTGLSRAIQEMASCPPDSWRQWQEQTIQWGREVADLNRGANALRELYARLVNQELPQ